MPNTFENRRLNAYETLKAKRLVESLYDAVSLQHAVKELIGRAYHPDTPTFERYAGMSLLEAGAGRLSDVSPFHMMHLLPPEDGKLARIVCANAFPEEEQRIVSDVENVINRLVGIADALEDGFIANAEVNQGPRLSISMFGAAPIAKMPAYRSAYVKLPLAKLSDRPSLAYFNEVDWRVIDNIASNSHAIFQSFTQTNGLQSIRGAYAPAWSDWDTRTRLATIIESLELPFAFSYSYDCDAERNVVSICFREPVTSAMPAMIASPETLELAPIGTRSIDAQMVYTMRLACLMAAVGFGSGRYIEKTFVRALSADSDDFVLSCEFDRNRYVHTILSAIDDGSFSNPSLRFDIDGVARMMESGDVRFSSCSSSGEGSITPHDDGLDSQRIEPWLDFRTLEPETQRLFRAQTISELDTQHYFGPSALEIEEAKRDAADSAVAAIARLEGIVDALEAETAHPGDDADARPLYCANPYARAIVSIIDESSLVGADAEAYLHDDGLNVVERPLPRYFRAPNALYHAHMGLSDLYERLGDLSGAESEANRCIALAPTTVDAHFRKAHLLAQRGRFVEAANVILSALPLAVTDDDCAMLYYHLGLLLWNLDRKSDAAAVFTYTTSFAGGYAEKARKVVDGLRKRKGESVIVHASPKIAAREMARSRIPVAPSEDAINLVSQAAIALCCAHAPCAATPYAHMLARYCPKEPVVQIACKSVIFGVNALTRAQDSA